MKVTYEFEDASCEDSVDLQIFQSAQKLYSAIHEIDNLCRNAQKYMDKVPENLPDQIRSIIVESGYHYIE